MIDVSVLPWAEIGFWFSAVWTVFGVVSCILLTKWMLEGGPKSNLLIGIACISVPVFLLSLFGHLAFG